MAFCSQCGQQIPDDANNCPYCGTAVNAQTAPQQTYQQPTYQQQAPQQGYAAPVNATVMPDQDVQSSRGIAWLSYVGLLFLIPMFVKKESPYCQYHVKQGATLFAVELAYWITKAILLAIINLIFPGYSFYGYTVHSGVYNVFSILFNLAYIFLVVLMIIGIVNAAKGNKKELPLISKIPWIATLLDKTVYKNI
ncbi:MAG: zinc ribbon domain-containing protein [Ruminococcus sp.]|nr:zinc ribbon domain-containing protein [Ruminococcus sp.]